MVEIYLCGVYNIDRKEVKNMEEKTCCHKTKERSEKEYKDLIHRLNRIEGQVRGIKKMVEDDRDCSEVLIQLAAVESAIRSTSRQILRNHMETCVTAAIQQNDEETLSELYRAIDELLK